MSAENQQKQHAPVTAPVVRGYALVWLTEGGTELLDMGTFTPSLLEAKRRAHRAQSAPFSSRVARIAEVVIAEVGDAAATSRAAIVCPSVGRAVAL